MDIRQLQGFNSIAEFRNMSRAAEALRISQPALSKSMARLEEELGTELFERRGRRITVNAAGARFGITSERILQEIAKCREDLRRMSGTGENTVRIGLAGACGLVMRCMASFKKEADEPVEYQVCSEIDRMQRIDIKDFDILIFPDEARYEVFGGIPLKTENSSLAVFAGHPLSEEGAAGARQMEGLPMIWCEDEGREPDYAKRVCEALRIPVRTAATVSSRALQKMMIEREMGCAIIPESLGEMFREGGGIRLLPVLDGAFSRRMLVSFRREKHLSPIARKFREHLIREAGMAGTEPEKAV